MGSSLSTTDNGQRTTNQASHPGRALTAIGAVWLMVSVVGPITTAGAGSSPVSSDPLFHALLIDGRALSGRIVSFEAGAITVATKEGAREELPFGRVVKLTREVSSSIAAWEDSQSVILPEGDRLMRVAVGS